MLTRTQALSLAVQSGSVAAASNYLRGRMDSSNLFTEFEEDDPSGEQTGVHERATSFQSSPITIGHMVNVTGEQRLYPHLFGYVLIGLGYKVTTQANTPVTGAHTHTFVIANADEMKFLSAVLDRGEGGSRAGQKAINVRLASAGLNATRSGNKLNFAGNGIAESPGTVASPGAEPNAPLSPATGGFTLSSSDLTANTIGAPQGYEVNWANPLDTDDQNQHTAGRADLQPTGLGIEGSLQGLVFSPGAYGELTHGGASGTAAAIAIPEAQLTWNWESVVNITGTTKYKCTFLFPTVQARLREMDTGRTGKVRYAMRWRMLDRVSGAPCTITLINGHASYAGT